MRLSIHDIPMETVEYMWVNIWCMLDWIDGFCHKTTKMCFLDVSDSTSECKKQDALMAGLDEICKKLNPLHSLTFHGTTCEKIIYVLKAELKMDACETVKT